LLYTYTGQYASKYKLAKEACSVEIEKLGEPIGKQDQFAAAFGGLKFYEFLSNGFVNVEPVIMSHESYSKLEHNLLMFYLGGTHSASEILEEQSNNIKSSDKAEIQKKMCNLARKLKDELQKNNVDAMGQLLHENWLLKKSLASGISNPYIDTIYEKALNAGATGGKLLGAGGAGFMLFYVPEEKHTAVREALIELREMDFEMDNSGASIVMTDKDFI
jgi:D-glycero-alpha-D-manno-heptose-7-phosphate kinase